VSTPTSTIYRSTRDREILSARATRIAGQVATALMIVGVGLFVGVP
jgi:hypothetical protein